MDPEHPAIFPAGGGMLMHDRDSRKIHCLPAAVQSPGDIYILRIHEETLVENPPFNKSGITEQQIAAEQIGAVERVSVVVEGKEISLHPFFRNLAWQETFREKVEGRGKHTAGKLKVTVRIIDLGHHHPYVGVAFKIAGKNPGHIPFPPYVGIHDEVAAIRVGDRLTQCDIVAGSESSVGNMDIAYPGIEGAECGEFSPGRVIDEIDCGHI